MAVTNENSVQYNNAVLDPKVQNETNDWHGRLRIARFTFTQGANAGDAGAFFDQSPVIGLANPLAQIARADSRAARARADEARGARFPRLNVTSFLAPSPKIDCLDVTCSETDPDDVTINIAGVFGGVQAQVTQPLYTFGKLSSIGSAARKAAEASRLLEDHVAGDLVHKSAQAYYGLKLARELVWMLEDGKDEITKGRKTLEERLAEGSGDVTVQDRLRLETLAAATRRAQPGPHARSSDDPARTGHRGHRKRSTA